MANRNFASAGKIYSMHVSPVMVDCQITIGSSGAVASIKGAMIDSVAKTATGKYTITLQDNFNRLFSLQGVPQSPSSGLSGVSTIELGHDTDVTAKTITIKTLDAAGALVDPASGSVICVMAILSNSSVIMPGE